MAHSESHYRAAAHNLGKGFLGSQFDQSCLSEFEVSRIHRIAAFREEAELMGLKSGSVAGVLERDAKLARSAQDARKAASQKSKRAADNILFLNLLEQESARLGRNIAEMEARFEETYGDAWRETIANQILDPDEIPERRKGESITEYRERLEQVLIDKMIDPATGEIRPEYASNPDTAEYARWAKDQYDKSHVDADIADIRAIQDDPSLTEKQKQDQMSERFESMDQTRFEALLRDQDTDGLALQIATQEVGDRADNAIATVDAGASIAGF